MIIVKSYLYYFCVKGGQSDILPCGYVFSDILTTFTALIEYKCSCISCIIHFLVFIL